MPNLGLVYDDISKGVETMPIPVTNSISRDHPSFFKYSTQWPTIAEELSQLTGPATSKHENCDRVVQLMVAKKKAEMNKCCQSSSCRTSYGEMTCTNCSCASSAAGIPAYITTRPKQNDISDSDASDSFQFINPKFYNVEDSTVNEIWECGAKCVCSLTDCANRLVQNTRGKIMQEVELKMTRKEIGYGLFSKFTIEKGSYIGPYTGKIILYSDENWKQLVDWDDSYFFETCLGDYYDEPTQSVYRVIVDSKYSGNATRFINHSCEPNIQAVHIVCDRFIVPVVALFANRKIKPNEELFLDYSDAYWLAANERQIFCKCGSRKCRYKDPDEEGITKKQRVRKSKKKVEPMTPPAKTIEKVSIAKKIEARIANKTLKQSTPKSSKNGSEAEVKPASTQLQTAPIASRRSNRNKGAVVSNFCMIDEHDLIEKRSRKQ